MIETVRTTLLHKRDYEAELFYLREYRTKSQSTLSPEQQARIEYLKHELSRIHSWITLLTEDEAFIIKRHYFDGIDLPRIALEFNNRWGTEYGRDERTLKRYQARALNRIAQFEVARSSINN